MIENEFREVTATTIDNPFNPFDEFNEWFLFDTEKGYYTSSKLGRLTHLKSDMTQKEENEEVERAVDELISIDPLDIYIKVVRES